MKKALKAAAKTLPVLALLALSALPAVFTSSVFGYLPALLILSALGLSLLWLLLLRRSIRAEAAAAQAQCLRGEALTVALRAENRSPLLCPRVEALFLVSDPLGGADGRRSFSFVLGPRRASEIALELEMPHVGCCDVRLEALRVYGLFGLLALTVPCAGHCDALVLPRLRSPETLELGGTEAVESDRDSRVTVVGGTDYTGVREYSPGDPMKQIHWKLSAHARDYMTRLQESARQQEFAIVLDFLTEPEPDRERLLELNDCLIETSLSLGAALREREQDHSLLYADAAGSIRRSVHIDAEAVVGLLRSFSGARTPTGEQFPDAAALLRQEGQTSNRAANVLVVTSRVTEELLQELQRLRCQRRSPRLFRVVPADWTARERETEALRLRPLDELEIPYYFVSTAESFSYEDGKTNH